MVSLEDVLHALARAAAGQPLRSRRAPGAPHVGAPPPPLPPAAWHERAPGEGGVTQLRADFAFELCASVLCALSSAFAFSRFSFILASRSYDLNGDGSISAEEVAELVQRSLAGNARSVNSTLRAIGAVQHGRLSAVTFGLMCSHAPNFVYPAFALQEELVGAGRSAGEALHALHAFWDDDDGAAYSACSSGSAQHGAQHGAQHAAPRARARSPGGGAASAPPLSEGVAADLTARAFRAARLGRTADVEAALLHGGVSVGAAFEPHRATLLHVAAAHGHRQLCRRLLLLGAPPRARDALGRTAAEVALAYRHWPCAEQLQAAGVPASPAAQAHAAAEAQAWAERDNGDARDESDAEYEADEQEEWRAEAASAPPLPHARLAPLPPRPQSPSGSDADAEDAEDDGGGPVGGDGPPQPGAWRSRSRRRGE